MDTIKKAMMICVSCKDWNFPRHILLESENFTGERIDELALRCFEMYKTKAGLPDLELIDYTYYGDVETLKEETSDLYWVSFLIQETCCSKPWLNSISTGCTSLDEAMELISDSRKKFRVLSAWIDTFENDIKSTVYHKCYVNAIGAIDGIKEGGNV